MAKKTPASNKRTTAPKRAPKSTKKRASRKSTVKKPPAAQTARAPRARAAKSPARKSTQRAKAKSTRRAQGNFRQTVDGYVATLNDWRKDCVASLRKMIRTAAPQASEKVKWSQPVYEHHGPFAWIKAHAKHVNLGFWRGVELPDPRKLLKGTGEKMRHIKLGSLKEAGKKELQELVRLAARLNEIKGSPTRPAKKTSQKK
jgi:hypothetical protein